MHVFNFVAIIKGRYITAESGAAKVVFILVCLFIMGLGSAGAQTDSASVAVDSSAVTATDNFMPSDSLNIAKNDTTVAPPDPGKDSALQEVIDYSARDSIDNDLRERKVYLYGDAQITFGTITLKAERIVYDFEKYQVHAEGVQDTAGVWVGLPEFKDGGEEYDAFMMDYNFKSKKALIKKVETGVIEGTLTGKQVKIFDGGSVIYVSKGEYCPCEDPDAKTRFKINKLKVIKDDKIVTGPGYLAFYGVPTPLAFPFGFFPNTEKKQAGLIVPSYGNGRRQGYFLNDLGFYLPIGDNVDTKFLTDIYSRGSWGLQNYTRYKKRYRYDGNFNIQYNNQRLGDRELNTFQQQKNFFITWRHMQDPKANPLSNFSADVNAGSSSNFQNNLNASQNDFLTNTFRSNIRYQRSFYDSPWNLALNAGHDQNSLTGQFNFTLPDIAINRARTFPLKGLFNNGVKQRWYEKFGLTYSSSIRNTLTVDESQLRLDNLDGLSEQFRNGMQHRASVTNSLKAGPFTINPSFSYTERWYTETTTRVFNQSAQQFEADTVPGFARNADWNVGAALTTKLYGMYTFKSDVVKAIRHTVTPSVSISYRPDFGTEIFGFYGENGSLVSYSPFETGIFGVSPSGTQGAISFSLINNLEAKVAGRDSTGKSKKVAILENLTVNGSYNIAADSLNFSPLTVAGRTKVTKYANLNFRGSFDPYARGIAGTEGPRPRVTRVNTFLYQRDQGLVSFETGNIAINANGLGSQMFQKKGKEGDEVISEDDESEMDANLMKKFVSGFKVPWNLNFGYSFDARRVRDVVQQAEGFAIRDSIAIVQSLQMNGSFDFFKRVKVNFNTGYDFLRKEVTPTTILISVDLNCWELNARVVPFGFRQSYNISLNIKSTMLRDLKLERNRNLGQDQNFFQ